MQFVNDDMDELFRESAENYPLNTGKPDWEQVLQKMQDANVESHAHIEGKSKKKYYWSLLLLLPMFFICNHFTNKGNSNIKMDVGASEGPTSSEVKKKDLLENPSTTANPSSKITKRNADKEEPKNSISLNGSASKNILSRGTAFDLISSYQNKKTKNKIAVLNTKNRGEDKQADEGNIERKATVQTGIAANTQTDNIAGSENNKEVIAKTTEYKPSAAEENNIQKEDSTANDDPAVNQTKEEKKKDKHLYIGFLAGPDYSMVKSSTSNRVGYSVGLVLGYGLAQNFSIETGVLWDRKRYKMEGHHFNKEKMNLMAHSNLLKVWGYCDMIEIPVNVRYSFLSKGNHSWFATAGLSSYLMKKEDYGYSYERYGNQYQGWKAYKNASTNWLSVANLSIGYQKQVKNIGQLRIEPYLKLPLGGVGIGEMPLRSTGVYLGFTRPIR